MTREMARQMQTPRLNKGKRKPQKLFLVFALIRRKIFGSGEEGGGQDKSPHPLLSRPNKSALEGASQVTKGGWGAIENGTRKRK